jgi:death-on-curing protein
VRYLSLREVIELHSRVVAQSGGANGVRDIAGLQAALGQPLQTFAGEDLYPTIVDKAAAVGFFLCANHPFVDGNKRVAHAALEVTLVLNGLELHSALEEQERVMLAVAAGNMSRELFTEWVRSSVVSMGG